MGFATACTLKQNHGPQLNGCGQDIGQRLLTVREAAEYLGLKPTTLYDRVARRKIPFVKLNGALRFDLADLE